MYAIENASRLTHRVPLCRGGTVEVAEIARA